MTQAERLDYMINILSKEMDININLSQTDKKAVLRSLMNIRPPKAIDNTFIKIQDEYLNEEAVSKGIVEINSVPTVYEEYGSHIKFADRISIWQGDITRLRTDAVVNAANSQMLGCFIPMHKCIDNCIHSFAGIQLRLECNQYMIKQKAKYGSNYSEPTGTAVLTSAYNLPSKHIIHTVGPIVYGSLTEELIKALESCYINILKCCVENNIRTVAFCCISTGEFHFPNNKAAEIAVKAVTEFLNENSKSFDRIIFNVFKDKDRDIYKKMLT